MNVLHRGPLRTTLAAAGAVVAASGLLISTGLAPSFAADPAPPAPPSTGADVPLSYFGPPPSQSFTPGHDQLVGPQQLLKSG